MHPSPQAASTRYSASSAGIRAAIVVGEAGLANRPLATSHVRGPSRCALPSRPNGRSWMYVPWDARPPPLDMTTAYLVCKVDKATTVMLEIHERFRLNVEKKPRRATMIRPYRRVLH